MNRLFNHSGDEQDSLPLDQEAKEALFQGMKEHISRSIHSPAFREKLEGLCVHDMRFCFQVLNNTVRALVQVSSVLRDIADGASVSEHHIFSAPADDTIGVIKGLSEAHRMVIADFMLDKFCAAKGIPVEHVSFVHANVHELYEEITNPTHHQ